MVLILEVRHKCVPSINRFIVNFMWLNRTADILSETCYNKFTLLWEHLPSNNCFKFKISLIHKMKENSDEAIESTWNFTFDWRHYVYQIKIEWILFLYPNSGFSFIGWIEILVMVWTDLFFKPSII